MKQHYQKVRNLADKSKSWPRWLRLTLKGLGILLLLQLVLATALVVYVKTHQEEVLAKVTEKLNENLNGTLTIGGMEPSFFENFPRISLHLSQVVLRDKEYAKHQKTLLSAGDFNIAVNALAFLKGSVEIYKIGISNASVHLFTDGNGYSNSAVFKNDGNAGSEEAAYPDLKKFELRQVALLIDNQLKHKRFHFKVSKIKGTMDVDGKDWKAAFSLDVLAKSLSFSTQKGSFIKDKQVQGDFEVVFAHKTQTVSIVPNGLDIGGEDFIISAEFKTLSNATTDYAIHIVNEKIMWRNAGHLLTPNIYARLDLFDLKQPIAVRCDISGNFDIEGDPLIAVKADIKDNELTTPGGVVSNCNFTGIFNNSHEAGKGINDANSVVKLEQFTGTYAGMPFEMPHFAILNFENPFARGHFNSKFELKELGNLVEEGLLKFSKGTAAVNLDFEADIVNYLLTRPIVSGTIAVQDGTIEYTPRKLRFDKTNVLLDFKDNDLLVKNIHLQTGRSRIDMQGKIGNFLNMYYTAPEKVTLDWKIDSPEIHLGEFLQFLGKRQVARSAPKRKTHPDFTQELNLLFDKSRVNIALRVNKLFYHKFLATNVKADVSLSDKGIVIKNGALQNSGGSIQFDAAMAQQNKANPYHINAVVRKVHIGQFFDAFDDFGLKSLKSKNLRGELFATTKLQGQILESGKLLPRTIVGKVAFSLQNGALHHFEPITKIGKYAFPLRNLEAIAFQDLNGSFDLKGEKVVIAPMQINSSALNMDVDGLYSFGKGTSINISVPLRNPEKDKDIKDAEELAKRRERGVVVRLQAADDENGEVKIKLVSRKKQLLDREQFKNR